METVNQQFMQRIKYGIVNLALIIFVITLACVGTWTIAEAALWQSIIASALTYLWSHKDMQLPLNNELIQYLIPLTIAVISFKFPMLYTPNFLSFLLSSLFTFYLMFDDLILLTPLRPYFMSTAVPSTPTSIQTPIGLQHFHDMDLRHFDRVITRLTENMRPDHTEPTSSYVLSEPQDVTKTSITCEVNENQCTLCLVKPQNSDMLMFAQPKEESQMGVNSTKLSSFYHQQCFETYRQHEEKDKDTNGNKAISTMPNGNKGGTVHSWYLGEYKKDEDRVEIITCYPVIKSTSKW